MVLLILYKEYYFDAEGNIAFIFADYRTFYGNVRIEYRIYFDDNSNVFKRTEKVFDLKKGRLLENAGSYAEQDITIFFTAQSLLDYLQAAGK